MSYRIIFLGEEDDDNRGSGRLSFSEEWVMKEELLRELYEYSESNRVMFPKMWLNFRVLAACLLLIVRELRIMNRKLYSEDFKPPSDK